ncbi:hypothetical protein NOS3756_38530 [Nostoc sp. NIES-3756]|uniref:hypothetical protein n=1 Tax=Nostoc sp. NIES-3756 TaxID=1751286 RepID=UPI0007212F62|nr:hypothetical protein [Nostoc sp. NIES-3756]BAT54878.1 hypothetical protein NOS3756_38530 [Nostoc sp. NIES-3756]
MVIFKQLYGHNRSNKANFFFNTGFIKDPFLVDAFFDAQWLPESPYWQGRSNATVFEKMKQDARKIFGKLPERQGLSRFIFRNRQKWKYTYDWQALEKHFLAEWATPELDLDKS